MASSAKFNTQSDGGRKVAPDGGYGWIVVAAAAAIGALFVIPGIVTGVIFNYVMGTMSASAAQVTTMATLLTCVYNLTGPFSSSYTQRASCRKGAILGGLFTGISLFISVWVKSIHLLTFTFGCLAGLGISFASNSSAFVINEYFVKLRGRATGIRMTGSAIGRVVFSLFIPFLMQEYGYKGLLLISSSLLLNICVCGALFQPVKRHLVWENIEDVEKPLKNENSAQHEKTEDEHDAEQNHQIQEEKVPDLDNDDEVFEPNTVVKKSSTGKRIYKMFLGQLKFSMMKTPIFYVFFLNNFAICLTYSYANMFMYSFVVSKGLEQMQAGYILSCLGICDIFGRLIIASLMDFPRLGARTINIISCLVAGTMLWCLTLTTTFTSTIAVACILGFFGGGQFSGFVALCAKIVGPKNVPTVFGLTQLFQGIILLGFGPLMGKLRDMTGDFRVCYSLFAAFNYLAVVAWLIEVCVRRIMKTKKQNPT